MLGVDQPAPLELRKKKSQTGKHRFYQPDMSGSHGYHRVQDAAPRDDEAAHSPDILPDSEDLKVILVGYDRQTSPGAVELPDAVYMLDYAFGSVVPLVFTLEVVDPDSVSNLYFHNSFGL